jgi:uncharacterized membrane protein
MRQARTWDITVESDWFTALGAVALFIVAALLLVREIDHFIRGRFSRPVRLHMGFWSIWNKVFQAIAAIYCFIAFKFRNKYVRIASVLMGMNLTGFVLLSCFQIPTRALHIASVSGSAVRQIALAIFCVALAQWLRSVVRWGRRSELPGGKI